MYRKPPKSVHVAVPTYTFRDFSIQRILQLPIFTFLVVIGSRMVFAVPSVTGVAGTFDDGATVVLTGSGFGSHPDFGGSSHGVPDHLATVWKNFEDSTLVSDGLTVENNHTQSWSVESTGAKTNSAKHGKRFYFAHGDGLDRISGLQKTQSGTTGKWFFSYWIYCPAFVDVAGGKQFRLWGSGVAKNLWLGSGVSSSGLHFRSECTGCSPYVDQTKERSGGYKASEWQRIDVVFSQNPSEAVVYRNMQKFFCIGPSTASFTNCTWMYSEQFVYNPFGGDGHTLIYGHMMDLAGTNRYFNFDDLYATYSLAHVELCSKATWNELITGGGTSGNKCEVQIPVSWSNGVVSVNFNPGSFTTGQTAYLYVISDAGSPQSFDVNPVGIPVVIGETGSGSAIGSGEGDITGVLVGYAP